jgi:endoglucanase
MNRRDCLFAPAALALGGGLLPAAEAKGAGPLGVTLAGPEFGVDQPGFSNRNPGVFGRDYTYNSERTTTYFCRQGLRRLRIPVRWERLQPALNEALDPAELGRLRAAVGWARNAGGEVILDVHNFGRYFLARGGKVRECIIDEVVGDAVPVSRAAFADLWGRLAAEFKDEPAMAAFGLMNEPHDMGKSSWKLISQAAVDAIRRHDRRKLVLVAGDDWSSAARFARANGPWAWVKDPADNVAYEAHCYFDENESGKYQLDYKAELARDPDLAGRGVERLVPFAGWCQVNRVRGFLGEFGVPPAAGWLAVLAAFLTALRRTGMAGCWWAAGEWWKDYPLSLQPSDDFRTPAPQMAALLRDPPDK